MLGRFILLLFLLSSTGFGAVLKSTVPLGCSPEVARTTHFMLSADYSRDTYTPGVDDYLSDKPPVGVISDIEAALKLATAVWGVKLTEFGSLKLNTCRGMDTSCRVGMIVNIEALAHRLTTSFVVFPEGPALFMALPERATGHDLQNLRHSVFYGMGLGVFDAVAGRQNIRLFKLTQTSHSMRPAEFAIDEDLRRADWRREGVREELPGSHFRAAADLFAYAFAREAARRADMPTDGIDALMKLTGLEHSAVRLKLALAGLDPKANERVLLEWGDRLIKKAREWKSTAVLGIDSLPDLESSLRTEVNAVRIAKPDALQFRKAQEGLRLHGELLEARRMELVAERIRALDDLIVRDLSP